MTLALGFTTKRAGRYQNDLFLMAYILPLVDFGLRVNTLKSGGINRNRLVEQALQPEGKSRNHF